MSGTKPRKTGCENCRVRHVKCEGGSPCVRCNRRGLDCNKGPRTRFRQASIGQSRLEFPAHQTWCNISGRKVEFVDQTLETTRYYHGGDQSDDNYEASSGSRPSDPPQERELASSFHRSIVVTDGVDISMPDVTIDKPSENRNRSRSDTSTQHPVRLKSFGNLPLSTLTGFSPPITDIRPHPDPIFPPPLDHGYLADCGDLDADVASRKTLESFLDRIGPSIDPCDQYAALAAEIVERALMNPQLLSPVIQLGETQDLSLAAPSYVSPGVDDFAFDGVNTLVTAFLYRLIDNIRGLATESTSSDRAIPIRDAVENLDLYLEEESSFVHQVIWASLRQELFIAITNHETACLDIDPSSLQNLQSTCEDEKWTNRIFLQLISAVKYCFGDSKSSAAYDKLVDELAQWMQNKPASFEPIFFQSPRKGQQFPEIWFLNDFAAVASQYYHIVRILLIAHNPRMPRLGRMKRDAARLRDDQVKSDVQIVCAIAVSRGVVDPLYLSPCMAIALAGDKFTDAHERASLLDILVQTQNRYGWSTLATQEYLKDSWET